MIVIGYQGIGKSTLAKKDNEFIDLESSNFFVDGVRADNWYIPYCNIAEHLSQQGYIVFVSSHAVVRSQLEKSHEKVACCVPAISLKDEWINKLQVRYNQTGSEKDFKAWKNAQDCYRENINDILSSGFDKIVICDMNYDLRQLILEDEATYYSCTEVMRRSMNAALDKFTADLKNTDKYRKEANYYKKKYHQMCGKMNILKRAFASVSDSDEEVTDGI